MDMTFETALADAYTSSAQKVRVLSEGWVSREAYCPNCGRSAISRYGNNNPAADFFCSGCDEEYELKSQKTRFSSKIVDGAYRTMIDRIKEKRNPNLFLLNYDSRRLDVLNLIVVPKHFLLSTVIERRPPLSASARRAGWTGCNILLQRIPDSGRIFLVRDRTVESKAMVRAKWRSTLFLREQGDTRAKGWLLDVMRCVESLGQNTFSLDQIYGFERELSRLYPGNLHVRAKIRQQVQVLRDKGYLDFLGGGRYRISNTTK